MNRMTSTHTVELEAHEVKHGDADWFCEITAEVEVTSGTDYGDGGVTTYGSGPWIESEIDTNTVEAECVRLADNGEQLEKKTLFGREALQFTGAEDELIERAESAHH